MKTDKRRQLRDAFGAFMTGVTVVTTADNQGQPVGFTANSFTSVSLEPALLLVSINKHSANLQHFICCTHFAVNILAEQQQTTSNIFASKSADRFAQVAWRSSKAGVPLIDGCSAWFECERYQVIDAGDHNLLLGRITDFDSCGVAGLGYYRGAYYTPYQNAESLISGPQVVVSALIEFNDSIVMVKDQQSHFSLPASPVTGRSVSETLHNLLQKLAIPANPGFVYSIYDNRQYHQQHIVFLCSLPADATCAIPPGGNAQWFSLTELATLPINDAALKSLIERFINEHAIGNYSIYYGDENSGSVKQFAS